MENNNDNNQQVIKLLQEQNHLIGQIQHLLLKHEIYSRNITILKFIFTAIPYIALVIIVWLLYRSIEGYLDALNHNINSLKDGFLNLEISIGKLIPDFSKLKDTLEGTWQSAKNIFN